MKHIRADYQRIQDPENKIPADEPVFLLRGQDMAAADAVRAWAAKNRALEGSEEMSLMADAQAALMDLWRNQHTGKKADLP